MNEECEECGQEDCDCNILDPEFDDDEEYF